MNRPCAQTFCKNNYAHYDRLKRYGKACMHNNKCTMLGIAQITDGTQVGRIEKTDSGKEDTAVITVLENELAERFGNKLQPVKAPLKNRQQYARLVKLMEDPYKIKGGCQNADSLIRTKARN